MRFRAFDADGESLLEQVYYSIGGGFIWKEGEEHRAFTSSRRFPIHSRARTSCFASGDERRMAIWQIALENEKAWHRETEIRSTCGKSGRSCRRV